MAERKKNKLEVVLDLIAVILLFISLSGLSVDLIAYGKIVHNLDLTYNVLHIHDHLVLNGISNTSFAEVSDYVEIGRTVKLNDIWIKSIGNLWEIVLEIMAWTAVSSILIGYFIMRKK